MLLVNGHAQIDQTGAAILKPKLVPGDRLVKNDLVSFVLSAGSRDFALVTETEQPVWWREESHRVLVVEFESMRFGGR